MTHEPRLIQKSRLDALVDGVFAVAMTLLVIDIKLPEGFHPATGAELLEALSALKIQFLVYVISFLVLGMRWASLAQATKPHETVNDHFLRWSLIHLFLITCIPFSTMVVGRYGDLAPAIWIYAGNTLLAAFVAMQLLALAAPHIGAVAARTRRVDLVVLVGTSLLVIGVSLIEPRHAMWFYLLNVLSPVFRKTRSAAHGTQQ
ncbi:MAG: DUF1211 domain-containing protein [Proteobacteria bacterium]|nr:DUF1211 domain-containing protein [Pseudomonadota bacterium]